MWNILFMDDDAESARSIMMNLKHDFNICHYVSSKDALDAILNGGEYELLILDYDMASEGTGIDVLSRVKKNIYDIPAVMISAVINSEKQVQEAMNAGFVKYFAKYDPNLIVKLRASIIELLGRTLDPLSAIEKWIKEVPGRENVQIPIGDQTRSLGYILTKLKKDSGVQTNQRMILIRSILEYLVAESTMNGGEY
jgi:CheY-like chemotaxis protein